VCSGRSMKQAKTIANLHCSKKGKTLELHTYKKNALDEFE